MELRDIMTILSRVFIKKMSTPSGSQFTPSCISLYPVAQEHFAPKVPIDSQKCVQSPLFTLQLFSITGKEENHIMKNTHVI